MSLFSGLYFCFLAALRSNHPLSVCTAAKGSSLWMNELNKAVTAQTCWLCIDSGYSDPSFLLASLSAQIYNVMSCPHMTLPLKYKVTSHCALLYRSAQWLLFWVISDKEFTISVSLLYKTWSTTLGLLCCGIIIYWLATWSTNNWNILTKRDDWWWSMLRPFNELQPVK